MLGRIYTGELKKIVRPKAMIVLTVVLAVFLLIYAIVYNFIGNLNQIIVSSGVLDQETIAGTDEEEPAALSDETIDIVIQTCRKQLDGLQEDYKGKFGYRYYSSVFSVKAQLKALEFMKETKLYDAKIMGVNYSLNALTSETTADGFAEDYMGVVTSVIAIYAIVLGAGLLADEYRNGTIKLLLTRPISKNQLITAKLLAALTVCGSFMGVFSLLGYIYGLIAFKSATNESVYLVFNATSVIKSTVGAFVFGDFIMQLARVAIMMMVAYFLGTLSRKKTTGIIVALLIQLGIVSGILGLLPVQIGLLVPNLSLMNYFNASANVPTYGNFFISFVVDLVYIAAVTFGLYYSVNKRDVI